MAKKSKSDQVKNIEILSDSPQKNIPKFCTAINFGVLDTKNIVMTLTYSDSSFQPNHLIERVIVDYRHAKKIAEILNDIVEKIEKKEN